MSQTQGTADEGNWSRRRLDLNLSPSRNGLTDLGSNLDPDLPRLLVWFTGESHTPTADMPGGGGAAAAVEPPSDYHALYSPTHVSYSMIRSVLDVPDGLNFPAQEALPTVQENDELHMEGYNPIIPMSPSGAADRAWARLGEPRVTYFSTVDYPPLPPDFLDEADFDVYQPLYGRAGEFFPQEDESILHQELIQSHELHRRTLIDMNHQLRQQQQLFRISNSGPPSSPGSPTEQLVHDIASSQRELGTHGKHGALTKSIVAEDTDEETKEKIKNAANFECNICLDMAKEPVVTSCGHLFCWSCLYQWLHLHSDHRECPVCKGEVTESNITPIYGRGSSEPSTESKLGGKEESYLEIPPRPRGNRSESFRQQSQPISRRFDVINSLRRLSDRTHSMHNRNNADPTTAGIYDGGYRTPTTRTRARRVHRDEGIPESAPLTREFRTTELPGDSTPTPQSDRSSSFDPYGSFLPSFGFFSRSEISAAMAARRGTMVGRFASSSNQYAAITSSANPLVPELAVGTTPAPGSLAADQASASSTMAVIQGDIAFADASVQPNNAGSSRSHRRRARSTTSGSLDVDGGSLLARRRRLN